MSLENKPLMITKFNFANVHKGFCPKCFGSVTEINNRFCGSCGLELNWGYIGGTKFIPTSGIQKNLEEKDIIVLIMRNEIISPVEKETIFRCAKCETLVNRNDRFCKFCGQRMDF